MREVFISYKSNDPELGNNDGTVAKELCEALEAAGISCWIAPRDIEPGKRYGLAIMEAIKSCKVMLVVFSRYANESEHIATEVEKAFTRRIDIIPFNIDGTSPGLEMEYYLGRPQWIDAADDYHKGIPALIAALRHKLGERDNNDQAMKLETPIDPPFLTFTVNGLQFRMIRIEGGSFKMGATPEQEYEFNFYESPVHEVRLSTFHIGEIQVTRELWQAVMGNSLSKYIGNRQCPVAGVSWNDCQVFISRLNQKTGRTFRLPTEAEWEFAARGGVKSEGYKFAGSNNLEEVAWTNENELGLYDMTGNVWEWCQDWFGQYNSEIETNPSGPLSGSTRVIRGGSIFNLPELCRVSYRLNWDSSFKSISIGLRLAL